jgi:antitoxin MazE
VRTRIVRIGNSQGVRIPKALLQESGLGEEVELTVRDGTLVIAPADRARQGWADAFRRMAELGDDELLDGAAATSDAFDAESWEWE